MMNAKSIVDKAVDLWGKNNSSGDKNVAVHMLVVNSDELESIKKHAMKRGIDTSQAAIRPGGYAGFKLLGLEIVTRIGGQK